jgi:hypothetical protein
VSDFHFEGDFLDASHATLQAGERALDALADYVVAFLKQADDKGWRFGFDRPPS